MNKKYIHRFLGWLRKQRNMLEFRWLWSLMNSDDRREWGADIKFGYWRSQQAKFKKGDSIGGQSKRTG